MLTGNAKTLFMSVNCSAFDNGRSPNQSCNGVTNHDNVLLLDVAGIYRANHAGTVRFVGTSINLCAGTIAKDDMGDLYAGGVIPPTAYQADASAQLYLDGCSIDMPAGTISINQQGGAIIQTRNMPPQRGRVIGSVGTY